MCYPFKIHNMFFGAPARSRTQNLLVRSQALYPIELQALTDFLSKYIYYLKQIKKIQPKYVLYSFDGRTWDGNGIYERIKLVNSYVLSNYEKHSEFGDYIILEKK